MERVKLLKSARAMIRHQFSLLADDAINELLPRYETLFNEAVAARRSFELDTGALMIDIKKSLQ